MDVAHIPLALRNEPPVGYFSYFSNAHSVARATGGVYTPQLDKASIRKGENIDMAEDISWLTRQEVDLSTNIDKEVNMLQELHDGGVLAESRVKISSCYYSNPQCGKTEYQDVDNHSMGFVANKHRLDVGGMCSLCNHKLESHEENALLMEIPEYSNDIVSIQTPYLKKNIEELFSGFAGQSLMISRLRETGIQWGGYNIDNDFSNYISLHSVTDGGDRELLYLASANTSMAVMGMIAVSQSLNSSTKTSVIALPRVSFVDRNGDFSNITIPSLREAGVSRAAINLVLLLSMGASSQNITLESREFGLMQRRLSSSALVDTTLENVARFDDIDIGNSSYRIPNKQDIYRALKELSMADRQISVNRQNILAMKAIGSIVRDYKDGS